MKKTLCLLLVISMLLATLVGIGLTANAATDTRMLGVKYQLPTNLTNNSSSTAIRLIAAVDDLDKYSHVGWCFSTTNSNPTRDGANVTYKESSIVYTSLYANGKKKTVEEIYSGASYAKYLFVFEISGIPKSAFGENIYVRSYVELTDGTIQYGEVSAINVKKYLDGQITYNSDNSGWTSRWY